MFVNGAGAERGPDVFANEFFAEILDVGGGSAGGQGFFARGFEIFLLADVADHGDDFAAVIFLEPGDDDGGVQTSGVGEDDFFRFGLLLFHGFPLLEKSTVDSLGLTAKSWKGWRSMPRHYKDDRRRWCRADESRRRAPTCFSETLPRWGAAVPRSYGSGQLPAGDGGDGWH